MAFSETDFALIEKVVGGFCRRRNRPEFKDQLSLEFHVKGQGVIVFERRPRWDGRPGFTETPVAKLAYTRTTGRWRLYWMRGNLKWHPYKSKSRSGELSKLMAEVDADVWGCFFG